jgi:hypothetical protein
MLAVSEDRGPTADQPGICVPPEDEAVQRALAEVDAKLATWSTAMREAQVCLAEAVQRSVSEPDIAAAPCATEPADDDNLIPPADVDLAEADSEVTSFTDPDEAEVDDAAEHTRETIDELPPESESVSEPMESALPDEAPSLAAGEIGPAPDAGDEDAPPPADGDSLDDDQTVLDSLDEETATAIRVMRRLDPDGKSIRELLEEYEAQQAAEHAKRGERKTWWKRKR